MNKKGFAPLVAIVLIALVFLVGYFVYSNSKKSTSSETKPTINDVMEPSSSKGTIEITDLAPPDFEKQTLKNLKIDKVNTTVVPKLQKAKQSGLIRAVYAAESVEKAVYKVKRNPLTADQALALVKEWGFGDSQITKKDIRNDYEYFLDWGELQRGTGPDDPINQRYKSGDYDLLRISLVWDKKGKYGVGPYNRSSFAWHKSTANLASNAVSKDEASKIALDFLKSKKLLPEGKLEIVVKDKNDPSSYGVSFAGGVDKKVYINRTIDNLRVIDGGVSMRPDESRLVVGLKGNQVIDLSYEEIMTQIDFKSYDFFSIKSEKEALEDLLSSKTVAGTVRFTNTFIVNGVSTSDSFDIEIDWSRNQVKNLQVKDVSLAFYRNENHTEEPVGNYYQPVYVFSASGTVSGENFPQGEVQTEFTFYVPAVKFVNNQPESNASSSATN